MDSKNPKVSILCLMLLGASGLILHGCSQSQTGVYIPVTSQLLEYHREHRSDREEMQWAVDMCQR